MEKQLRELTEAIADVEWILDQWIDAHEGDGFSDDDVAAVRRVFNLLEKIEKGIN